MTEIKTNKKTYSSIIYTSQINETVQVSISGWMDTEDVVYIYTMEYDSAIKKNEILGCLGGSVS